MMERRSDQHGPRADDALKRDTRAMVQSNRGSRVEDWRDPEPAGEDEPVVDRAAGHAMEGAAPRGMSRADADARAELAAALGRAVFPARKDALVRHAADTHATDAIRDQLDRLPDGVVFDNVEHVWEASGHSGAQDRYCAGGGVNVA